MSISEDASEDAAASGTPGPFEESSQKLGSTPTSYSTAGRKGGEEERGKGEGGESFGQSQLVDLAHMYQHYKKNQ